jgi:UDP-N-acetylglucosamine acyltransferase
MRVHATAIVDASATLPDDVQIGPYCVIGPNVILGQGSILHSHVVLAAGTRLGEGCECHAFAVLGGAPQTSRERGVKELPYGLSVGARSVFREHVTVHSGTLRDTVIGDDCLLMAGSHVGHDAALGSHVVVANGVQIAGHVWVEDYVTFGGLSGVAQRCTVGESAFVAAGAMCERDVPPYVIVQGDRARVRSLNHVGLKRRCFTQADIDAIERMFRQIYIRKQAVPVDWLENAFAKRMYDARYRRE